jgi:hypothetical protein
VGVVISDVWHALDNREKSFLIWTVAIVAWIVWKPDLRPSIATVIRTLVSRPLGPLLLGGALYVTGVVTLIAYAGVWTLPLLGVTVLWCVGPGGAMFFNVNTAAKDAHYLRTVLRRTLAWVLIVEFLANLYVFNLVIELVLLPVVTLLVLTAHIAETKREFAPTKKLLDALLTIFGVVLLARAGIALATDFDDFATVENLMRLVLPPALTIAFLPYMYFLLAYMRRDERRFDRLRRERPASLREGDAHDPVADLAGERESVGDASSEVLRRKKPAA